MNNIIKFKSQEIYDEYLVSYYTLTNRDYYSIAYNIDDEKAISLWNGLNKMGDGFNPVKARIDQILFDLDAHINRNGYMIGSTIVIYAIVVNLLKEDERLFKHYTLRELANKCIEFAHRDNDEVTVSHF